MNVAATLSLADAMGQTWEAVVVGAGPAGAMAARGLVLRRRRVLLIDKARFPRDKVCGCCLGGATLAALRAAGLGDLPATLGAVELHSLRLSGGRCAANVPLPGGAAISRGLLDAELIAKAVSAGAHFLPETVALPIRPAANDVARLDIQQHGGRHVLQAKVVIVADGLAGMSLAEQSPPVVRPGSRVGAGAIAPEAPAFYRPGVIYMACGDAGYVGMVRIEDGQLDIAAALDAEAVRRERGPAPVIERVLREQRSWPELPGLADLPWRGTPALTRRRPRPAGRRFFAIGDAAGYVEPFTGEGIGWAMHSALALAPIADRAIERWDDRFEGTWIRRRQRLLAAKQFRCRAVARVLRSPLLIWLMIETLRRAPVLALPFVKALNGKPT